MILLMMGCGMMPFRLLSLAGGILGDAVVTDVVVVECDVCDWSMERIHSKSCGSLRC